MESGTEDCFSDSSSDEHCYPNSQRTKYSPGTDDCGSSANFSCSPYTEFSSSASPAVATSRGKLKLKICFPMLKKNIMKRRQSSSDTCDEFSPDGERDCLKTKYLKKVKAAKYVRKPDSRKSDDESSDDITVCYPSDQVQANDDGNDEQHSKASCDFAESLANVAPSSGTPNSIVSLTHRELMLTLKDAGALDCAGHLFPVSRPTLTVKLVMAAVNVLNFSYEDICSWVNRCRAKVSSKLTDRYSHQFDCYKIMYRLICSNIETANGQELLKQLGVYQYRSPKAIHGWQIIFHEIPLLLKTVSLFGSIQDQSVCLNATFCGGAGHLAHDHKSTSDCSTTDDNSISKIHKTDNQLDKDRPKASEEVDPVTKVDRATTPKGDVKNCKSCASNTNSIGCVPTSLVSEERLNDFLSKVELLSISCCNNKTSCESDALSRMERIERNISSNNKANWPSHVEELCEIEELRFHKNILLLNSGISFVKGKDFSISSVHVQKEKSLKEKPVKEKLMFLYQSNRSKSRKISFLRSQVHLLERLVDQYTNRLQCQKRVCEVLKRKTVYLGTIIGEQKSRVLEHSEILAKSFGPRSPLCNHSKTGFQEMKAIHIPLQILSSVQISQNLNCNCNFREPERSVRLFSQQASAASRIRSFDCSFNAGGRKCSEAATQCDLIFDENLVMKLPNRSSDNDTFTNTIIDTMKRGLLNFASEKFKSDLEHRGAGSLTDFKRLVDNLILLELMLEQRNVPVSTDSSAPASQMSTVICEAEKPNCCVDAEINSNSNTKKGQREHLFGASESSSVQFGENVVDISLFGDPHYWEHADQDLIERVVSGLAPFLALDTNPRNSKAKQEMVDALCDKEAYDKKVDDLRIKIISTQEQYEEQLKQTRLTLRKKYDQKVKALENKLQTVQHNHDQESNNKMQQMSETMDKYSTLILLHESTTQEFQSFRNSVIAGEEMLSQKLDSVYVSVYHSLLHEDPTVVPPEEMKLHAKNVQAKVSSIFSLCNQVPHLRRKLEEYKSDCERLTDLLLSVDTLSASLNNLSTSLGLLKQQHRSIKNTTNTLTERYEVTLQNYEKEKIKLDLQNEELMLSNAKLTTAGRQIGVLVSSLETQEMALKYERERIATKLTASEELCAEKETRLNGLRQVLEKEQWKSSVLRKELDDARFEIRKLAVFWDLIEVDNSRVSLNLSKTSSSTENTTITAAEMSMLEHITQWAPNIPGTNDTANISLSSDFTQLSPCESSTSLSNICFNDSGLVSSTVALESSEDISSLAEFVFGDGRLSAASSPVSSSTVQTGAEVVTLL